jgi:uncharacterized protein YdeI (YjbR/CyaY-like superfamily)
MMPEKLRADLPILPFVSQSQWTDWLAEYHSQSAGVWLKLAKKGANIPSITYDEALDSALCYGWIDGQKKGFDDSFWLQKFMPRGPKSIWSKINTQKAEKLIQGGAMQPAGLKAIELAQQDGRWEAAYDSQKSISIPADFQAALDQSAKAKDFFVTLNGANRYALLFRIQTAKKGETRAKRIQQFIEMLERNQKFHP